MMILNIAIGIIFYVNAVNAGTCRDFEKCRDLLPPDNSTCSSIQTEMASAMGCIANTGACDDLTGAGILYGACIARIDYYNSVKNCSFDTDESAAQACGLANQTKFQVQYKNNQSSPNCSAPSSCDSFATYSACVKSAADNDFTRGKIVGTCLAFRSNATNECNFDEAVCGFDGFGSDSNSTNTNNTTNPTASSSTVDSGAGTTASNSNTNAGTTSNTNAGTTATPAESTGSHIAASFLTLAIGISVTFLYQNSK